MALAVPLKVMVAVPPAQSVVVPEIVAVGNTPTVITAVPVCACEQVGVPAEVILTKVYVLFEVNAGVVRVADPEASNTMV